MFPSLANGCPTFTVSPRATVMLPGCRCAYSAKTFGHYLKSKQDRVADGLQLRGRYNTDKKVWRYRVAKVKAG